MYKFCAIKFTIFISVFINAQNPSLSWAKKFVGNNNIATSSAVDPFNNIYTIGYFWGTVDFDPSPSVYNLTVSGGGYSSYISKLDSSGNFLWAKQFDAGNYLAQPLEIYLDAGGNIYTIGYFWGTVDFDPGPGVYNLTAPFSSIDTLGFFISKLDVEGNFVWAKQAGNWPNGNFTIVGSVFVDTFLNVYVTGSFVGTSDFDPGPGTFNMTATGRDPFILKLNANGDFIWAKQINDPGISAGTDEGMGFSIFVDGNGFVYSVGQFLGLTDFDPGPGVFNMNSTNGVGYLQKLDNNGNFIWAKQVVQTTGTSFGCSYVIKIDNSGNLYCFGNFRGTGDFDPGPGVFFMNSYSNLGNDLFVTKLNSTGDFIWVRKNSSRGCYPTNGIIDNTGNVYISGNFIDTTFFDSGTGVYTFSPHGEFDGFVTILNPSGYFKVAIQYGSSKWDETNSINVDASGNIYAVGRFKDTIDFDPCVGVFNLIPTPSGVNNSYIVKVKPKIISISISAPTTTVTSGQSVTVTSTIINGGTNPSYQWQDSTFSHNWQNISVSTNSTLNYSPALTGDKLRCLLNSNDSCAANAITITSNILSFIVSPVTSIYPVAENKYGIRYYPNPVRSILYIDSLKISDQWQTIEVISMNGKSVVPILNIANKTFASLNMERLRGGQYIAILESKKGIKSYLKIIKQ